MAIEKTLTRHGNSLALVIDRPVLDLLGITADTLLEIRTDGESLIISPRKDAERTERIQSKLEKINKRHAKSLRKLAE